MTRFELLQHVKAQRDERRRSRDLAVYGLLHDIARHLEGEAALKAGQFGILRRARLIQRERDHSGDTVLLELLADVMDVLECEDTQVIPKPRSKPASANPACWFCGDDDVRCPVCQPD